MPFSFAAENHAHATVLRFSRYVNLEAGRLIRSQIQKLQQRGKKIFILDFSKTTIVNSAALGELIELVSRSLEEPGLQFLISGLAPTCQRGFNTVGIFTALQNFTGFGMWQSF